MLELKESLEEREASKEESVHDLKRNHLLPPAKRKREDRKFPELAKRAKYNPRYFEEFEQLLGNKDFSDNAYDYSKLFLEDEQL